MNPTASAVASVLGTSLKDLDASGLSLSVEADGSLCARADRAVLRHARLPTVAGLASVSRITLAGLVIRLSAPPAEPPLQLLGLAAGEVQLENIDLTLAQRPQIDTASAGAWRLDAVGALDGLLRIFIRDATWVVDADIAMPISGGRVDFDRVVVDHLGPNSSMGVSRDGIYVDAPGGARTELFRFATPQPPGAQVEARGGFAGGVSARGSLDLRPFAQAWLEAAHGAALGKTAGRTVDRMLDRTKLSGELRLGDGALGTDRHHLLLSGQAQGKNRVSVSAAVLGHRLVLRLPALSARSAVFEVLGRHGGCGAVAATLEVHATGLSGPAGQSTAPAAIGISVHHMTLHEVSLGDLAQPAAP
ncbi:MAG TPA: hypothetical protein VGE16_02340 [Albitalea sp.]